MKEEIIYGVRPVIEALRSKRREVYEVLNAVGDKGIASEADTRGVRLRRVRRNRIEELAPSAVHQGVVARVGPYPYSGLKEILTAPEPLIIVLDSVADPRNLGAVLRAATGPGRAA